MSTSINRIKNKIKALSKKTIENGCTEAEAVSAIQMIGKLLEQYNLSMNDIDLSEKSCVRNERDRPKKRNRFDFCIPAIAYFCDCKAWLQHGKYVFFGLADDVEFANYVYDIIYYAYVNETDTFKKTSLYSCLDRDDRRSATVNFQKGFVLRISNRLRSLKDEINKNIKETTTGTSVMVVKQDIISRDFDTLGINLTDENSKTIRITDLISFRYGQSVADNVNLNRPLTRNKSASIEVS